MYDYDITYPLEELMWSKEGPMDYSLKVRKLKAEKKKVIPPLSKEFWDAKYNSKMPPPPGWKYERGLWNFFTSGDIDQYLR